MGEQAPGVEITARLVGGARAESRMRELYAIQQRSARLAEMVQLTLEIGMEDNETTALMRSANMAKSDWMVAMRALSAVERGQFMRYWSLQQALPHN